MGRAKMPRHKRIGTDYPGVFYIEGKRRDVPSKTEKIYYISYRRKDGRKVEEKIKRELSDWADE
jgi:hypothetical protein